MSHPAQLFDVLHVHPTLAPTSQVSAEAASARLQQTLRQLDQSSSATARFGAAFPAHVRTEDQYLFHKLILLYNIRTTKNQIQCSDYVRKRLTL
jgi:hypothetical protein